MSIPTLAFMYLSAVQDARKFGELLSREDRNFLMDEVIKEYR